MPERLAVGKDGRGYSIHPYADRMRKLLQENMGHSVIIMEEYDMQKVMNGYEA